MMTTKRICAPTWPTRRSVLKAGGALAMSAGLSPALLAQAASDRRSWVPDGTMLERLEALFVERQVAGASFAILEDGDVAWTGTYGHRNTALGDPVTRSTLFQVASLSKPIFAYVVMNMIGHGLLGLDDRLADYVRPTGYADSAWARSVTVRHALTHRSGLPNWRAGEADAELAPAFEPGSDYSYSGEAYSWLQEVVEAIAGKSLQDVAQHYLFAPAKLGDMAYLWLPGRDHREVYGHKLEESGTNVPDPIQLDRMIGPLIHRKAAAMGRPLGTLTQAEIRDILRTIDWPDGVLRERPAWLWQRPGNALANAPSSARSSAYDYARFLALMLPGRGGEPGLLDDAARRMMITPQAERPDRPEMPPGIGWGIERYEDQMVYQHWGRNGAQHCSLALADPATGRGIVAMANSETGGPFIDAAAAMLTRTPYKTFV